MGQCLGHGLLERLVLETPGDQVAVRADQEGRVRRPHVVVEHDRIGPAVSEDGLRPGHVVGLDDALDVREVAAQIEAEHREPLIPAEPPAALSPERIFNHAQDKKDARLHSLPMSWTDLGAVDPFVAVAAGRSPFRVADLLELVKQIDGWKSARVEKTVKEKMS